MGKIKHDEAINILQLILTFIVSILRARRKKDLVNDNDEK